MRRLLFVLLIVVSAAVSFSVRNVLDPLNEREMLMDMAYLPDADRLNWMSGGMDDILSDILWLRSMRYVMSHFSSDRDYTYLFKIYDMITDFDPNFVKAYRFGGYFLTGITDEYAHARDLLKKGWDNNRDSWEIAYELGSVYNLNLKDPISAAEWFGRAARNPNCPSMIREHATVIYQEEGRLVRALEMWLDILEKAEGDSLKKVAEWNVKRIKSLILIGSMKAFVERFREEKGSLPQFLNDLVDGGLIAAVPRDAYGEDFVYFSSVGEGEWPEAIGDGRFPFRIECKELMRRILDRRITYLKRFAIARFKHEYGRWPASLEELTNTDALAKTLPFGILPDYDPATGDLSYDRSFERYGL